MKAGLDCPPYPPDPFQHPQRRCLHRLRAARRPRAAISGRRSLPSFGVNGETTVALDRGFVGWPKAVAVQADGKTVVAGYYFNDASASPYGFALARYTLNGQPDTSFGDNHTGRVRTIFQDNDDALTAAMAVAIQPDGKIVAAGRAHEHFAVARYNSDGTLDASFDGRGFKFFDYGVLDFTSEARAVLVQSDRNPGSAAARTMGCST